MVKLVAVGAVVVAGAAYVLRPHGASAAKVASCLEKVVMLWFGGPAAESRAVVEGCF